MSDLSSRSKKNAANFPIVHPPLFLVLHRPCQTSLKKLRITMRYFVRRKIRTNTTTPIPARTYDEIFKAVSTNDGPLEVHTMGTNPGA